MSHHGRTMSAMPAHESSSLPDSFWSIGTEVGLRSKVVEVRWCVPARCYEYRLNGIDGWYYEEELTT